MGGRNRRCPGFGGQRRQLNPSALGRTLLLGAGVIVAAVTVASYSVSAAIARPLSPCSTILSIRHIPTGVSIVYHGLRLQNPVPPKRRPPTRTVITTTVPTTTVVTTTVPTATSTTTVPTTTDTTTAPTSTVITTTIPTTTTVTKTVTTKHPPVRTVPKTPLELRAGDRITVRHGTRFTVINDGNRYVLESGEASLRCSRVRLGTATKFHPAIGLVVELDSGSVDVRAAQERPQAALTVTRKLVAEATTPGTDFVVSASANGNVSTAQTSNEPITVASAADQKLRITSQPYYTAIDDHEGLRLNAWPFSISTEQRAITPADALPPYWDDGSPCAVGCNAAGAIPGWPLKPFHQPHALQGGYTDYRSTGFHVGIDVEGNNFQRVYAIQSGVVRAIRYPYDADVNVDIGNFDYWHIQPTVGVGQWVTAYKTVIGTILWGQYHVDVSENGPGGQGDYLNPLRPGGSLLPFSNTIPPVIGSPQIYSDDQAAVSVFDPQNIVQQGPYLTPIITPAAVAWRLYNSNGAPITGLEWALRGTHWLSPSLRWSVYAPGAFNAGWNCFAFYRICKPNFRYWLAGGLTESLPLNGLPAGRYRLTVYAWNYAGQTSALDDWINLPLQSLPPAPTGGLPFSQDCPGFDACADLWFKLKHKT